MEPKGSLPYSQESATGLCREPDEPSLYPHPVSLKFVLMLFSHLYLGLSSGLFQISRKISQWAYMFIIK
jgi:hypothetical protein